MAMSDIQITREDLDRLYFYVRYILINPDHHRMLDYEDGRERIGWEVEDGAKQKYANPQWEINGRQLKVRIHIPSSEIEIAEDGGSFRYCREDVLDRCEDALNREGYELIKK